MPKTISYREELEALVRSGIYKSKMDAFEDVLRTFFGVKAELRQAAAIELWKEGKITTEKGANMCGVSLAEFVDLLASLGLRRTIKVPTKKKLTKEVLGILKYRKSK